ncbi:MAG: SMC-Scp complex subunit ScpB [Candidatus Nanoarchaeia archaeon]|jgi:segregation and condensation protein B
MSDQDLKQQIEALLFATQGLNVHKIVEKLGSNDKLVIQALNELSDDYNSRDSAFIISQQADLWKLMVKTKHVELVKDLIPSEFPKSLLETLGMIAWKNPARQSDIIKLRGNKAYNHIKQLEDIGFLTSNPKGKSCELKLTDKFYDYFNAEPNEIKKILKK